MRVRKEEARKVELIWRLAVVTCIVALSLRREPATGGLATPTEAELIIVAEEGEPPLFTPEGPPPVEGTVEVEVRMAGEDAEAMPEGAAVETPREGAPPALAPPPREVEVTRGGGWEGEEEEEEEEVELMEVVELFEWMEWRAEWLLREAEGPPPPLPAVPPLRAVNG